MPDKPITISPTCQNGSDLCTLEVKVDPGQELKLGDQVCTSNNEGYLCGNTSLPRKYLPGTQLGTLALFEKDKQVAAQSLSLRLPATGPEICKWQETIFDKSLAEIKALPPNDQDYALFRIIPAMIEAKLYPRAEALIPQIKSLDDRSFLYAKLASATGNAAPYSEISPVDLISVAADQHDVNLFDQIIKSSNTNNVCYKYQIAKNLIKSGLTAKALPFVLSLPISGDFLDDSVCSSDLVKVDLLLEMNLPDEAERLIRDVLKNQPDKFTNTAKIESLLKVAKAKRNLGLFKLAIDKTRDETKSKPPDDAGGFLWYQVIEAMFEAGLDEPAAKLIDQMRPKEYQVYKAKALSLYARKKKSKELFEKAVKIGGKDATNDIAVNMAEAGFVDEAVALVTQNNSVGWEQEKASEEVAIATVKANAVDKGMAIVKPFIRPGNVGFINRFIDALIEARYFDQAIEIAEMYGPGDLRDSLLGDIVPKTIAAKDPHRAMALVESISIQKIRAAARAGVAAKMCP